MDRGGQKCTGCPGEAGSELRICGCWTGRQSGACCRIGRRRSASFRRIEPHRYNQHCLRFGDRPLPPRLSLPSHTCRGGLLRAGEPVPTAAINTLLLAQLPDGVGFGISMVLQERCGYHRTRDAVAGRACGMWGVPSYTRAADYLAARRWQSAVGGLPAARTQTRRTPTRPALAVGGLWAHGFDPQAARFQKNGRGALDTLLTFQEASGAFVYIRQAGRGSAPDGDVDALERCSTQPAESHSPSAVLSSVARWSIR